MPAKKETLERNAQLKKMSVQSMANYRDEVIRKLYNKTMRVVERTVNKAEKIQNEIRHGFDKEKDKYILEVTKNAWKIISDSEYIKIKKREVQQGDISLFNELQKEALSGNLSDQQIKDLEKYVRPNNN